MSKYYLSDSNGDAYWNYNGDLDSSWYDCDGDEVEITYIAKHHGPLRWLVPGEIAELRIPNGTKVEFQSHNVGEVTVDGYIPAPPGSSEKGQYILSLKVPASQVWEL